MKKRIVSALLALVLILSNFTGGGLIEHVHVEAMAGSVELALVVNDSIKSNTQVVSKAGEYTFTINDLNIPAEIAEGKLQTLYLKDVAVINGATSSELWDFNVVTKSLKFNGQDATLLPDKGGVTNPQGLIWNGTFEIAYTNVYYPPGTTIELPADLETINTIELVITVTDLREGVESIIQPERSIFNNYEVKAPEKQGYLQSYIHNAWNRDLFNSFFTAVKGDGIKANDVVVQCTKALTGGPGVSMFGTAIDAVYSEDRKTMTISGSDLIAAYKEGEEGSFDISFYDVNVSAEDPAAVLVSVVESEGDFEPFEIGLYVGGFNPDITIRAKNYGQYTIRWEGSKEKLDWLMVKSTAGNNISTLAEGTEIKFTSLKIDDIPLTFNNGESWSYNIESNGKFEAMLKSHTGVYQYKEESAVPKESVEVTFEIVNPNPEPDPEPEGFPVELTYSWRWEGVVNLFDAGNDSDGNPIISRYNTKIGDLLAKYSTAEISFDVKAITGEKANITDISKVTAEIVGSTSANGYINNSEMYTVQRDNGKFNITVDLEKMYAGLPADATYNEIKLLFTVPCDNPNDPEGSEKSIIYVILEAEPTFKLVEKTVEPDPGACPNGNDHTEEGWVEVDIADVTTDNTEKPTTWYIPFVSGDSAYAGDTVTYCFAGTVVSDAASPKIRFYLADGIKGSENDLTASIETTVTDGAFKFTGTTNALTSKGDHNSANSFYFKNIYGNSDVTGITFTHIYYKINHEHTPGDTFGYDGKYHWTACDTCGKPIGDTKEEHNFADGSLKCSGCGYTHAAGEEEIKLSTSLVGNPNGVSFDEDGNAVVKGDSVEQFSFSLAREVEYGETVKVHILASAASDFRFWLIDNNGKRPTVPVLTSEHGTVSPNLYDITVDIPLNYTDEGSPNATRFTIKSTGGNLPAMTIYHIGVVYPGCNHPADKQVTQFDLNNHWKRCLVCNKIIDGTTTAHTMVDNKCSGCAFEHYPDEVEIELTAENINAAAKDSVTIEDGVVKVAANTNGWINFDLGRYLMNGETVSVHVIGNIIGGSANNNGYLRAWLGDETNKSEGTECADINKTSDGKFYNGYFQIKKEFTHQYAQDAARTFALKANSYDTKLPELVIDHVAVVVPECPHNESSQMHQAWLDGKYFRYEFKDNNEHKVICTLCEKLVRTESHSAPADAEYAPSSDGKNHTYTCDVCNETVTEPHRAGTEYGKDATGHWSLCEACDEEVPDTREAHDALTYEKLDSDKHTVKCSTCEYTATEEHSWDAGEVHPATETEPGYTLYTCEKCDATKKEALAHVHNGGGEWKNDETSHWHECTLAGCTAEGGIYDKDSHTYVNGKCEICQYEHKNHTPKAGTYKDNGDTHTYVCDVCGATVTEGHKIVKVSDDPSGHYDKCEFCDYQTKPEPHTGYELIPGDFINHYVKCSCGYTAKEAHTPGADYEKEDDDARYHICTKCGGRCDPAYHDYTVYVDDENGETHHIVCSGCGHVKPNSTEKHVYENGVCKHCEYAHADHDWKWTPDVGGTTHTRTCSICHKTETDTHNLPEKWTPSEDDETKHYKTCPDCGYTVTETHTFGAWTYADENSHVQTCECGAEKTGTHDYVYTEDTITDTHHWQICSVCNHETEPQDHHYEGNSDRCSDCDYWNHQHQLEWRSNDTQHWQECVTEGCDYVTGRENHGFGDMTANETSHVQTCSKCGKTVVQKHQFEGYSFNTGMHWHECSVCQYKTDYNVHTLNDASDATSHWQECTAEGCDYETEHETHIPSEEYGQSDTQHWSVCTECGAEYNKSEHTIADDYKHDADSHWKYCEVCGKEETKSDHVWDTGEVTVEPTETTEGEKLFTCTECGETKTETVSKLEHTHVAGEEWKSDEKTHWHECVSETCDDKTAKLDEAAHTEDEGTVTKAATEAEEGVMTFKCTVCGAVTRTEAIPKVKHTHVAGKEWKFDEKTHWHECVSETCDDKTAKLDEAAHTEDEGTVTKAATETEEGVMTYKCTVCGAVTRTESIPKVKHTHVAGKEWKHDEKTHWHECVSETCDDKTAKLDEGEHVWDDGKVTVEPTYTKEGEKLYTCEVCGETKTETVPVKGHEHSTVTKSDENGHWEECTICGETVGEVEAHTPGEWITDSEATSTEAGRRHKECTVCGYVTDVLEVPATGDIAVEVPTVGNVPKVELPAEQQEVLKNAVIDEEDVEAIESGASIDIELTVENAESTIAPEDKAKSDEAAAQGSYTHVRYLDINLTKVVTDASGASTSEEISELGKEVRIVITVPLGLARQSGRDFAVIRVHDGEATVLKDLDSDPNTVTISTNLFSSYTLVYVDTTPVPSTPGGMIGHAHVITGLQNDAHYHWRGCFICSMRVDYEPHRFVDGVCTVCHYRDPDYVPEVEEEEPAEAPDTEVTVVDAPTEGTEQGGDSEGTPEVTDTPADLPETEAEVVEVKEDDETSENPKTGVVFTGIGAVMAAIAALVAKRK